MVCGEQQLLVRLMAVSVGAAVMTITLKLSAAAVTGSVGLLSDALESGVNLVAALVGLWAVRLAGRPADATHQFGHGKAEYLAAALEGGAIFLAAAVIVWTSARRIVEPTPLDDIGIGVVLSSAASVVNLAVGGALMRVGRRHRSPGLLADGKHLLSDVVTSAGVLVGIALVTTTGLEVLDPVIALLVGVKVLTTGYGLMRRSVVGMLDAALSAEDLATLTQVLDSYRQRDAVQFHAVRTRESGRQRFVYAHVLVPAAWTVKQGHDLTVRLNADVAAALPGATTFTHVEPLHDPLSYGHADLHEPVPPLDEETTSRDRRG